MEEQIQILFVIVSFWCVIGAISVGFLYLIVCRLVSVYDRVGWLEGHINHLTNVLRQADRHGSQTSGCRSDL